MGEGTSVRTLPVHDVTVPPPTRFSRLMSRSSTHKSSTLRPDVDALRAAFSWADVRAELAGLPGGRGLNVAHEAVDRHAASDRGGHEALRWGGPDEEGLSFTYRDLKKHTNRFATVLRDLDLNEGETVVSLLGPVPHLSIAALGTLKSGAVFGPLSPTLDADALAHRLDRSDVAMVVTTASLYDTTVAPLRDRMRSLPDVLLVDAQEDRDGNVWSLPRRMRAASAAVRIPATAPDDLALVHGSSRSAPSPLVLHAHEAALLHYATARYALDLGPDDTVWCSGAPGWMVNTAYGLLAPLLHGATAVMTAAGGPPAQVYRWLEAQAVTVWITTPAGLRALIEAGPAARENSNLHALRHVVSVGAPLAPARAAAARALLGVPVYTAWTQTEAGGLLVANSPALGHRPDTLGRPLPGIEAAVTRRTDDGLTMLGPNEPGELALRTSGGGPALFRGYLHEKGRYEDTVVDDWCLTGDIVRQDADGDLWFLGRADDVISLAGRMVSPLDIERALEAHGAVAEAGVVGTAGPDADPTVTAFVVLAPEHTPTDALRRTLLDTVRHALDLDADTETVALTVVDALPTTERGAVRRRPLRAQTHPERDASPLEPAP